jgi:signal transduction histidine kinase
VRTLLRSELNLSLETQRHFLDQVDVATDRLDRLIDDLFMASRLETGRLEIELADVDLRGLIREAVDALQQVTECRLLIDLPEGDLRLRADPQRLQQVLGNLLGNAIKFSPRGSAVNISAYAEEAGAWVHIAVQDEGPGIPPQSLDKIFDKFYRVDRGVIRKTPGMGLGLYICKGIIEAHGGTIWAESKLGRGSTFHVRLPVVGPVRSM